MLILKIQNLYSLLRRLLYLNMAFQCYTRTAPQPYQSVAHSPAKYQKVRSMRAGSKAANSLVQRTVIKKLNKVSPELYAAIRSAFLV